MNNTLVDKFNSVKVSMESLISQVDQIEVDKIAKRYTELRENLLAWQSKLEQVNKEIPGSDYYQLEKNERRDDSFYYTVDSDYNDERGKHDWASKLMFSPAYALKYIAETLDEILKVRNSEIVDYFVGTYSLGLRSSDEELQALKTVEDVIDYLVRENDGRGFVEAGTDNVIKNFKRIFYNATISKDKVTFPRAYFTSGRFSDECRNMIKGLSFFETGELESHPGLSRLFIENEVSTGHKVECHSTEKFKAIRLYMNHKCEMFFRDNETALEFFELFKLSDSRA